MNAIRRLKQRRSKCRNSIQAGLRKAILKRHSKRGFSACEKEEEHNIQFVPKVSVFQNVNNKKLKGTVSSFCVRVCFQFSCLSVFWVQNFVLLPHVWTRKRKYFRKAVASCRSSSRVSFLVSCKRSSLLPSLLPSKKSKIAFPRPLSSNPPP